MDHASALSISATLRLSAPRCCLKKQQGGVFQVVLTPKEENQAQLEGKVADPHADAHPGLLCDGSAPVAAWGQGWPLPQVPGELALCAVGAALFT